MKNLVVLKSFPNGISVTMDPDAPFEEILEETGAKFKESSKFFKNARLAVSFDGRELSFQEEMRLMDTIHDNSYVYIVCIVGKETAPETSRFARAIEKLSSGGEEDSAGGQGQFYYGSLKNGQILEVDSNVVLVGDVNPGSVIISSGDIVILGGLYGEANITGRGEEHFVTAMVMQPERITMGDASRGQIAEKGIRWPIKPKPAPKIAYLKDGQIEVTTITRQILAGLVDQVGDAQEL